MDSQKPTDQPAEPEADSLESLDTPATQDTGVISAETNNPIPVGPPPKLPLGKRLINGLFGFNIYLLLFVFVLIVAGVIVLFSYNYSKKKSGTGTVTTTSLSQSTLDQLANSDTTVGASGQVLNVQSSAVFAGKILARSDLEVAGNLQLGGSLNLPSIVVSDSATLGQVQVSKSLAVTGNTAVQGAATIAGSLQVGGSGNFSGPITAPQVSTSSLQLNGDLVLTHHLTIGGGTPGHAAGSALGGGGTATVGGSDTAGSITINTGSSPGAGCFITVNFTAKFNSPHVLITPVGSAAAGLAYYINRSGTSFSVCTATAAPASSSFGFDYFVLD